MAVITFDYLNPTASGDRAASGTLEAHLYEREIIGGAFRTIKRFDIPLVDGQASAQFSSTGPNQCWVIKERAPMPGAKTFYKKVIGDAAFTDLVDVDPTTFAPLVPVPPSAQDVLAEAGEARDDAQAAAGEAAGASGDASTAAAQAAAARDALLAQKGAPSGLAPLDSGKRVPDVNLPTRLSTDGLSATYGTLIGGSVVTYSGGLPATETLPNGIVKTYHWDADGNPTTADWNMPTGPDYIETFTYDGSGNATGSTFAEA